jgi:hypothetical protein
VKLVLTGPVQKTLDISDASKSLDLRVGHSQVEVQSVCGKTTKDLTLSSSAPYELTYSCVPTLRMAGALEKKPYNPVPRV